MADPLADQMRTTSVSGNSRPHPSPPLDYNHLAQAINNMQNQLLLISNQVADLLEGKYCFFCSEVNRANWHPSSKCPHYTDANQRWPQVRLKGLCHSCLRTAHGECGATCTKCKGSHHILLHSYSKEPRENSPSRSPPTYHKGQPSKRQFQGSSYHH